MNEHQTVAGAYAKIESHEDLCAERYRNINTNIGDVKSDVGQLKSEIQWAARGVWSAAVALIIWLLIQFFNAQQARVDWLAKQQPQPPAASASI